MANIPQYGTRKVTPSGRVGGAAIPFSVADTGQGLEAQALGAIGKGIGDVADIMAKIEISKGTSEASTARGQAEAEIRKFNEGLKFNNDPSTYDAQYQETIEKIKGLTPESGIGAKKFNEYLSQASLSWQADVNISKLQRTQSIVEGQYGINKARAVANGDIEEANRLTIEARDVTGSITPEQASSDLISNQKLVDKQVRQARKDLVSSTAFSVWEGTVTEDDPNGDLNIAYDAVQKSNLPEEDKKAVEADIKSRATNRRAETKLELEATQEADFEDINKLTFDEKNYGAAKQKIQASSLPESQKKTLLSDNQMRASKAAKGEDVVSDRVIENEMFEASLDIWRGAISKKEFDKLLIEKGGSLDDDAYRRVSTSAAKTLKSSQAEALSRANTEIIRDLVDFVSEDAYAKYLSDITKGMTPDAAKLFEDNSNEERQLQYWSVSRYNEECRQWISTHEDKVGKEFYQFREALKVDYKGRSIEDIERIRGKFEKSVKVASRETVTMISPKGKVYSVPIDKKQKALDHGYKEQ